MTVPSPHAPQRDARAIWLVAAGLLAALLTLVCMRVGHRLRHRRWRRAHSRSVPIPDAAAPWSPDIVHYAHTFDAVAVFDGLPALGDHANDRRERWAADGTLPSRLEELRACLFFEARRFRHLGAHPRDEDERYVRAVLEAIRRVSR